MKYTAVANNNINMHQGREFVSLSPKLASATYTDGFGSQYNSPKVYAGKGFSLTKSTIENLTLASRAQKGDSSVGPSKNKGKTAAQAPGASTPSHKLLLTNNSNNQFFSKSSSAKTKNDLLRTVSSTPKNLGSYKPTEALRSKEDAGYSSAKWKKLEINTEFTNTKAPQATKVQTAKHTDTDENFGKEFAMKNSTTQQSLQKSLQNKSANSYAHQNSLEVKTKEEKTPTETKSRNARPLSSSSANPRNLITSTPKGATVKENVKMNNFFQSDKEANGTRSSYKKDKPASSTTRAAQNSVAVEEDGSQSATLANKKGSNSAHVDLRSSWQAGSSEAAKSKERPLSAKKNRDLKEEQEKKGEAPPTQKVSLQTFVTRVNKGDAFGSLTKYSEKRDNSLRRSNQKPTLTLEEKSVKPIRAIDLDLKGSKTSPNVESKTFSINLGKTTSQSPTASTTLATKTTKTVKNGSSSTKETTKTSQELVVRTKIPGKEPFIYYMTNLEKAHRWAGEADYFVQIYREHFLQTFQALSFCKLLKPTDPSVIAQKKVHLPRRETHKDKKTLVFDMDETLIHCNESPDMPSDVVLPITFPNGEVVEAGINVRPFAIECLRELSQYYEIIVFTASHGCYANVVLDYLDPHEQYIHHRLFRESCVVTEEGVHIKDLRVIGNRNLQDVILIDNAAYSFGFQIENGIPIIPFYDNKADQELGHLIPYLKFLNSVKDLREINKQTFKLHTYASHDTPESVLERVVFQE